jgi:ABC-type nickel/cobalt efflux system permease component RcnA
VVRSSDARADCGDRGPRPLVRHRVLRLFPLWAILRAAIQLSIVALLLRGVLAVPWTAAVFVLLMLSTASVTAMGRTRELWRGREAAAIGVAAGALVSLGAILALQLGPARALFGCDERHHHRQRDERRHPFGAQLPTLSPRPSQRGRGLALTRRYPRRTPRHRSRGGAGVTDSGAGRHRTGDDGHSDRDDHDRRPLAVHRGYTLLTDPDWRSARP